MKKASLQVNDGFVVGNKSGAGAGVMDERQLDLLDFEARSLQDGRIYGSNITLSEAGMPVQQRVVLWNESDWDEIDLKEIDEGCGEHEASVDLEVKSLQDGRIHGSNITFREADMPSWQRVDEVDAAGGAVANAVREVSMEEYCGEFRSGVEERNNKALEVSALMGDTRALKPVVVPSVAPAVLFNVLGSGVVSSLHSSEQSQKGKSKECPMI